MHIALSKSIKEFKPGVETMTPGLAMYIKELCAENKVDVEAAQKWLASGAQPSDTVRSLLKKAGVN